MMTLWALAIGLGAVLGAPLTAAARSLARRFGQLDHPGGHKRHRRPIPVAGGSAVFWTVALLLLALEAASRLLPGSVPNFLRPAFGPELSTLFAGAFLLHLVGLVDDRVSLRPWHKLLPQAVAALPMVWVFEVRLLPLWLPSWASIAFSLLWFLAITNAFNFLDGLDGLLGSVGTICALLLGLTAVAAGQTSTAVLLGLLAGALLGFLVFNLPPASIYMGDSGSLVVGYLLAYCSIDITYSAAGPTGNIEEAPWYAVFTPLAILAIPLYDLVTVVVLRLRAFRNPTRADTRHFSHRLQRRGMRVGKVLVVISACTVATGLGGLLLIRLEAWQAILVTFQTLVILLALALLESAPGEAPVTLPDEPWEGEEPTAGAAAVTTTEPPRRYPLALRLLRKSLLLLPERRRWQWAGLVPFSVAAAGAEAAGAAAVFLLIALLSEPAQAARWEERWPALSALLPSGTAAPIAWGAALLAGFYLAKNAFLGLVIYLQNRLFQHTAADLARSLLTRYLSAPYSFHLRRSSAELIHRVTEGCHRVVNLVLGATVAGVTEALVVLGILAVLIATSPWATLITLAALGSVMALLLLLLRRRFTTLGRREIALRKEALGTVQDTLEGLKEIRIFGREGHFFELFSRDQHSIAQTVTRLRFLEQLPRLAIESLFIGATLVAVMVVAGGGERVGEMVPLLGLYAYAGFRIIPSFNRMIMHANNFWYGTSSVDDLAQDLLPTPFPAAPESEGEEIPFRHHLVLEEVSYAYDRGPILDRLNLTLEHGGTVGIVGSTGGGKSTLVDLLLGLHEPSSGRILADGVNIRRGLASWRRRIGYVPQKIFLLDDSLRRNIAFAVQDEAIDPERLRQALRLAGLDRLVEELPEGLATRLGEGGVRLSGGQRQRVAIARALYPDPELLIFDEATSALDGRAEQELNAVLRELPREKTTLIVAHRVRTMRGCERLIFLDGGRIAGDGTFDELLRQCAAFRAVVGSPEASR
ncbi:MAG: ATP-binding cassette domain-containing protein [Acidobacteriota bacterium]